MAKSLDGFVKKGIQLDLNSVLAELAKVLSEKQRTAVLPTGKG